MLADRQTHTQTDGLITILGTPTGRSKYAIGFGTVKKSGAPIDK